MEGGYNVILCGIRYYIAGRWRLYARLSEGKSAEFIPEKKKIVIYTREKLQKHDISSSYHNSWYFNRFSRNCFISQLFYRNIGGGYRFYHIITISR